MTTPHDPTDHEHREHDPLALMRRERRLRRIRSLITLGTAPGEAARIVDEDEERDPVRVKRGAYDLVGEPVTLDDVVGLLRRPPLHLACARAEYAHVRAAVNAATGSGATLVHVLPTDGLQPGQVAWLDLAETQCQACEQDRRALDRARNLVAEQHGGQP